MSNTRTQHHFSSNQAHDSVLGFREHLLAEFRRGGSSLHPPHVQQSRKSPASHSRETSTDSYFIPSKRRFVDPQANAHHTLSSSSALLHENTNGVNISSRSSYLLHRSNTGDNNTDLDISAMTAHDARLAHGGVNMPPTSRPTSCHHSYVEYFVDQCLARGVPEEIIAQHALYMIHSMRDGIYLYSELHRHRQNEAQLEHDMQDLSLQLMKSSRATSRATSPQQRRLLRSSGTMKNGVATTRSPAPSSPKVAHEPSLSAAAAARQESSGRVNDLPPSVNVSPESVMFRFPSPSRGGAAVLHGGESVSVLDDVLDTPPRNGREGEVHSGGSFSEQPVAPTDELRSSDAVAKRLDLRDDGIEHRAAHPQQSSRSSASSSTARNLAAGPTNHHQSTKSSMMEYNRTHRRVDPSSSSRHVAAPQQQNGPTASRESQAGRPSSQTGTQQSRGPPPPSTAADVVYTSRRTVTSNEILQRTTTTIQQPKPRGGNDVFSQHRLAEASSGTSGGLRRGSAVNSSSATLQRRPSFSSAGSFRIERNESQAQLVDRLSTPKKNSTSWHQEATVESTMQMRQPSEVNIVQPQSPPPPPPPLVHTAPVLLVPTTDPVSYRSRSSTSSVPLSPLELPGGSNRGPSTASAASSKVDARCFTRDEKQQGRGNSSFASTVASTTASTSAPPPGRSGQLSSTAPPSPTLLASTSRPTMNTQQQQHRTQTGAAINAASFSSPPQHDRNTFSGGSVIDESPLIVPRRRRGAAASSTTSTAVPLSRPHITTGVATASTATFVARTTASSISSAVAAPLMQHSGGAAAWNRSDSKAYASDGRKWHHSILVDDATQSSETGGGGSGTSPSNNGLLRGFPQRDIGDIVLEPPQSESPKLLRYLADTRNALAMIPPTLSSRRGSPLPQTNQRFPFELNRTTEPSARFSVSPNPTVVGGSYNTATTTQDSRPFEDDVVFVVKREGSPLRWQKRSAPSHTTFTTSVRHDDTDEDCISDLSSGDDDEDSMVRMAPQRKVLFSGGSSVSGGQLRSPVW